MAGRDLPFIGFTYVKERHGAVLVAGAAASPASPTSLAAVESRLDAELKAKTKEVAELRKKLVELQNEVLFFFSHCLASNLSNSISPSLKDEFEKLT